jgi:hypothetical protein
MSVDAPFFSKNARRALFYTAGRDSSSSRSSRRHLGCDHLVLFAHHRCSTQRCCRCSWLCCVSNAFLVLPQPQPPKSSDGTDNDLPRTVSSRPRSIVGFGTLDTNDVSYRDAVTCHRLTCSPRRVRCPQSSQDFCLNRIAPRHPRLNLGQVGAELVPTASNPAAEEEESGGRGLRLRGTCEK